MKDVLSYISPHPPNAVITLGRSRIRTYSDGSFMREPEDDALPVITMVVNDECFNFLDIVAWQPGLPGRWWLEYGQTDVLGLPAISYAEFNENPLTLFETPLAWCLGRGTGACLLSWDVDPRSVFSGIPEVCCESEALQDRLRRRIWECVRPNFSITCGEVRRAA